MVFATAGAVRPNTKEVAKREEKYPVERHFLFDFGRDDSVVEFVFYFSVPSFLIIPWERLPTLKAEEKTTTKAVGSVVVWWE